MFFEINRSKIGNSYPTYFIAEIGSNFDGNLDRAKKLIWLAKESGANAAKFQHYTADSLVSDVGFRNLDLNQSHQASWKKSVFEVYDAASLDFRWTKDLKRECDNAGIDFLTSPYSDFLIDYVDEYIPAYKIGSGDITYHSLIKKIAGKNKPILIGTGASSIAEVQSAYECAAEFNVPIVLMQCNTNYTADESNYGCLNLNVLKSFSENFPKAFLGISDHMPGHVEVLAAVTLGARVVEKHFTDSNLGDGPDHKFALEPDAFRLMVRDVRNLEKALGDGIKKIEENERHTAIVQRRALYAARNLKSGAILAREDFVALRPCLNGLLPPYMEKIVIGKPLLKNVEAGEGIKRDDICMGED